jgi:hypothetical protein
VRNTLVSPTDTPYLVGIGWNPVDGEIYAMSECCWEPIHYNWETSPRSWVCSSCKGHVRLSDEKDKIRASAHPIHLDREKGGLYNSTYVIDFIWWWTVYSVDDIQVGWAED